MSNRKKKILFISEAAYLNTGYAKYSKEVISRIHKTGKYEIAEFSIYGSYNDPRRKTIPWKNYANLPDPSNEAEVRAYSANAINQFGAWRFERVCLDFEPDIVFTIRDFWMDSFIYHSPFRKIFSWAWMPTVDASPQNQEWIDVFSDADYILTYSKWAKKILEQQGGKSINTIGVASPSAAECFMPMDRKKIREDFGIKQDINIIGTVMRNQRRKLFPALIEAFQKYLRLTGSKNTFLYLHTSFPDAGWAIPQLLHDSEISSRVLMTYVCDKCRGIDVSFFRDAKKVCKKCGSFSSTPASVGNGIEDKDLAKIYNIFDLYVQCANSEGFGLPQVEAAACGTPIVATNYSAMEDVVSNLGAYGIKYSKYKELETGCDRAVPDIDDIVSIFIDFFNKKNHKEQREKTRNLFDSNYSWDKTANEWIKIADDCKFADWKKPVDLIFPKKPINIKEPSINKFINDLIENYIFYENHKASYFLRNLMSDLMRGMTKTTWDGYYVSEFSPLTSNKPKPITREHIVDTLKSRLSNYNAWESIRADRSKLTDSGGKAWLT